MKRVYLAIALIFAVVIVSVNGLTSLATAQTPDPLPSWNEGTVKTAMIEFVESVTTKGSPNFVEVSQRIATFDNDGTLWPEQPLIQGMFVLEKIKQMAAADPTLKEKQPFQAALAGDLEYIKAAGEQAIMELVAAVHSNKTEAEFTTEAQAFFAQGVHPTLNLPYTQLAYQPMVELLEYLRANGFQTWICSGGGIDFIRIISEEMYAIESQQVIGSSVKKEFREQDGNWVMWRIPELNSFNDKEVKPVNIDLHIHQIPIFAAGNVRSGGDIAMLTYVGSNNLPSFQLLINHDDAEREFVYQEADNASLNAAQENAWQVVSMKNDWKNIFTGNF
ncbi:MAG: haloacid dehalogenase-like hydrolase [Gomphosphaeria aponina SAG 52.96 = DSM 107014]|uniref:Haloacid dehalogenase-like hydrolase n=1 Tax=Gomphosphaeria aponina SAG 52.96 = DSM 107014 TaxID=1521640 RepID=A0A941GXR1_9CHRO|nr:haloacid dehalogenase-like hydrolase [Gomphosphaeria aponina SAG 52.96 = DSM 107014]